MERASAVGLVGDWEGVDWNMHVGQKDRVPKKTHVGQRKNRPVVPRIFFLTHRYYLVWL